MSHTTLDDYQDRYAARIHGMAASEIRALFAVASRPEVVSLAGGNPYTAALPMDELGDMFTRLLAEDGARALLYCPGQGDAALREQICGVMADVGIDASAGASPDDVVVTVGAQQGLDLLARVFLDPGDIVLAEGPTYVGALGVFQAAQARVRHVAMDDEGLIPRALEQAIAECPAPPKFLYTVPTYQNPTGVTLSGERRVEVLEICERHGLLVVEDDPYGMLSFDGHRPRPLRAMRSEGVFYVGTFSKIFAAGLRVGWVLAPPAVRDKLVLASEAAVLCPSALTQAAATRYLTTMAWREQVKAFSALYCERRDAMLSAMDDYLPSAMTWTRPGGGLFVWADLPEGLDSKAMLPKALAKRVAYVPGTGFYADGTGRGQMRLNFSFPTAERIREGVRRLAGVIESAGELRDTFAP
ncbi:MAG TPA: PLP-dependent aminotransferase family protein [Stackebrandtia sp.]|jgi:DNA-binding transcriptional MocR family regulator|uniref:aminotransferase-like domain-containing protein n=1 Tax=Stackebrandtia sp. TaxID=2023065 RepID=UPI002D420CD9|nr:PLP-dependent aminotransferase family protein [Stackebrandtia sp.]HZE38013.1 PLP-dependent aminotransferase family protein [Stackebrandtia sp.]